jgi:hypothetical protein
MKRIDLKAIERALNDFSYKITSLLGAKRLVFKNEADNISNKHQLFRTLDLKPSNLKIIDLSFLDIISLYLRIQIFSSGIFLKKQGIALKRIIFQIIQTNKGKRKK